jgi:general secretion pathway protein K
MMISSDVDAPAEKTDGFGLITALMFVLLVAAVITPLAVLGRGQVLSSAYSTRRTAFELLAPGLSLVAYAGQAKSLMMTGWQQCRGKDKVFYLNMQDQNGLIGLNSASNPLLKIGFLSLGYNEKEAAHFSDRVETYREIGAAVQGDENDATFIPKHAPFENIAELYEVLTPPLPEIGRIADVFTIQNKTDSVTVSHSHSALREQLERHDKAQQFVASDDLPSEHAEVSFAEFKAGEPYGFLSTVLLERSTRENGSPKILEKATAFTSMDTLRLETREPVQCPDLLKKLTEGL